MAEGGGEIFQFKITLKYAAPPIWRRIQVPSSFTFKDLHHAIQIAMGWRNSHLHKFEMNGKTITAPFNDGPGSFYECDDLDEATTYIKDYFTAPKQKAVYDYDFGDDWCHTVILEKIEQAKPGEKYPKCIAGKRACPPEDCGSISGYEDLVNTIRNPSSAGHGEMMEWLENCGYPSFDPDKFSTAISFNME